MDRELGILGRRRYKECNFILADPNPDFPDTFCLNRIRFLLKDRKQINLLSTQPEQECASAAKEDCVPVPKDEGGVGLVVPSKDPQEARD